MYHKPTIDDRIGAIIDKDSHALSYSQVLDRYDITPNQFFRAVKRIDEFVECSYGRTRRTLEKIALDE
ncbi:hypothetical protein KY342_06200, partial [Candidatus Woesearchaeota archaeon]|nr:hypothetical protein [Candidatus Woesearchaeota archaeon]